MYNLSSPHCDHVVVESGGRGNVAVQINVIVQMSGEFGVEIGQRIARVANKLTFGHFILDGGTRQVHRQQYEREA